MSRFEQPPPPQAPRPKRSLLWLWLTLGGVGLVFVIGVVLVTALVVPRVVGSVLARPERTPPPSATAPRDDSDDVVPGLSIDDGDEFPSDVSPTLGFVPADTSAWDVDKSTDQDAGRVVYSNADTGCVLSMNRFALSTVVDSSSERSDLDNSIEAMKVYAEIADLTADGVTSVEYQWPGDDLEVEFVGIALPGDDDATGSTIDVRAFTNSDIVLIVDLTCADADTAESVWDEQVADYLVVGPEE